MKQNTEATIHDIARKLNISASTVSRALNNNSLISEKTRKRVKVAAEEMGYRPNVVAANLRNRHTKTIGIIVPLINRHFFSSVVSGVEEIAYNEGFTVTIAQSNDNFQKEIQIAKALFASRVDGVILSIGMGTTSFQHLRTFTDKHIPLVFFDRIAEEIQANKIVVDDYGGAYQATQHLIEQGCRNIAHIGGPLNLNIYQNRLKGYLDALKTAGLEPPGNGIIHNRLTRADGNDAISQLLKLDPLPDAVFCANDTTALSVITCLRSTKYSVPNDIAVVGFSNEPFSEVVTPSISTVRQPGYEMGKKAAELLINEIKGNQDVENYQTFVMTTELIIRESSVRKINRDSEHPPCSVRQ